jgi:NADP-reducing hydrogenase subunit HndD
MITSCSPGWIRYIEHYYPEYLPNLSSCKSPQQMQGAMIKHYYAKKIGVDPAKIKVVSIMPCIAKKYEANRPEMEKDGLRDIDYVLTTRELARLIKRNGIDFNNLADYTPESPLAKYTGAGVIFGATGGVMEAALRTVVHVLDPENEDKVDLSVVRGVENGIKEATLKVAGLDVNVAVVHGSVNLPELFKRIKEGKQYHFIEVMACTGGCINGGGQPIVNAKQQESCDVRALRASVLYQIDKDAPLHKSHENQAVLDAYKEFLGEPNSHTAHEILHTHYTPKQKFSK